MEELNLTDIDRELHPKSKSFTYVSKSFNLTSRIDYFLFRTRFLDYPRRRLYLFVIVPKEYIYACKCLGKNQTRRNLKEKLYYKGK